MRFAGRESPQPDETLSTGRLLPGKQSRQPPRGLSSTENAWVHKYVRHVGAGKQIVTVPVECRRKLTLENLYLHARRGGAVFAGVQPIHAKSPAGLIADGIRHDKGIRPR